MGEREAGAQSLEVSVEGAAGEACFVGDAVGVFSCSPDGFGDVGSDFLVDCACVHMGNVTAMRSEVQAEAANSSETFEGAGMLAIGRAGRHCAHMVTNVANCEN